MFIRHENVLTCAFIVLFRTLTLTLSNMQLSPISSYKNTSELIIFLSAYELAFCLFVCVEFFVPLKNFHSYGDVTIADEELQILTYAQH